MNQKIITKSFEQTQSFAQEFANTLKGGDILLLFGDLGAGKTTFMQGVAKGLDISQTALSPTFIIMRSYEVSNNEEIKNLYHLDLYRINSEHDLDGLGMQEIFVDNKSIVAIEWPEKLGKMLPEKRIEIRLKYISDEEREITINQIM